MFGLLLIGLSLPSPVQTVPAQVEKYVAPFADRAYEFYLYADA